MTKYFMIEQRKVTFIATPGSQRRCYNGCFHPADWEKVWTDWNWLSLKLTKNQAKEKLNFWKGLNESAVKERGPLAMREFRISPDTVYDGTW